MENSQLLIQIHNSLQHQLKQFKKNKALRTLSILIIVFVLTLSSVFVYPTKKAEAIGFLGVVPAGITVGAGAYVVGALAVGAVAGVVGLEYGDDINAHAKKVWATSTDLAKKSLDVSINLAVATGNKTVTLGSDLINWLGNQIESMAAEIARINSENGLYKIETYPDGSKEFYSLSVVSTTGGYYGSRIVVNFSDRQNNLWITVGNSKMYDAYLTPELYAEYKSLALSGPYGAFNIINKTSSFRDIQFKLGGASVEQEEIYNNTVSKIRESWESMRDAGLVLPVDSATAYKGDIVMDKYNSNNNTYTGIDGNVYNPSDLTWAFPFPKARVGQKDLPDGVYVDSPALTGNPVIDNALINNPAIPKTTTNIKTGVTTANPDIAITTPEVPVIPKDPPKEPVGTNPFKNIVPLALLMGLMDLLVAIILYLIRMFHFILTLGFIQPTVIQNPYFQWFQDLKILGVKPYSLTINLAIFFLGFSIYKSVRRVFG